MEIKFIASDPRQKARPLMESVMARGTDQLMIATAFCTAAGVALLAKQVRRLSLPNSFVVISAAEPTDYAALSALHAQIPDKLFIHWGAESPVEKKAGAALMHSKVIYARAGEQCWLWTGSHNFTANATQGANCEAAVLIEGSAGEQPFIDAEQHLQRCRSEASLYDPETAPPEAMTRVEVLVIHAESDMNRPPHLPCRMHLCLESSGLEDLLAPSVQVRLFLHPPGGLVRGRLGAIPFAALAGRVTGVNLTGRNLNVGRGGTTAEWSAADFNIEENEVGVPVLGRAGPPRRSVATQAVLAIDTPSNADEARFVDRPRVVQRPVSGDRWLSGVDADMRNFFRSADIDANRLVHRPIRGREHVIRIAEGDLRSRDFDLIRSRVAGRLDVRIETVSEPAGKQGRRHPFIMRAKYRFRDDR